MKIVTDFSQANQLLARKNFLEAFVPSPELATKIKRVFGQDLSPQQVVDHIISEVKDKGDQALFSYTEQLDGVKLNSLEAGAEEISAAYDTVNGDLVPSLKLAAERIRKFHLACKRQMDATWTDRYLCRRIRPLEKVGIYIPGGTAAYPSTVLMTAIPAKVAGVKETIMVSPPGRDGRIPAPTLVAAGLAEVNRIYKVGGAQAIAALAFGTESVSRVDKICGPGNIFVTLAKKAVYGVVDIDGLQGPSEIAIVADNTADPTICAADLLAQAEHDVAASAILLTTSATLANQVDKEVETQLEKLKRRSIAARAIASGMIIIVSNIDEAIELVNLYAPEHLSLMVSDASSLIPKIDNAGCIFLGEDSSVVLGDYVAGPSHVLPTGGSARFSSPLGIEDFLKVTHIVALDKSTAHELSQPAMAIARAEGLDAHAEAISLRERR